jgi:predicted phosphoribosyltransferase
MIFRNRVEAGRILAGRLGNYARRSDVTVLGIPRGGVVVAFEVAQALGAPLEVLSRRDLAGTTAILVDDGVVTGSGIRGAISALRLLGPERIVFGVPVCPASICISLRQEVDELVSVETPGFFFALSQYYQEFGWVSDAEVSDLLARAGRWGVPEAA